MSKEESLSAAIQTALSVGEQTNMAEWRKKMQDDFLIKPKSDLISFKVKVIGSHVLKSTYFTKILSWYLITS